MSLEFKAFQWLKFDKNCPLVIMERSPRAGYNGQPDVLGITSSRYMLEIEIKRSMSDFRANTKKNHIANRCCPDERISKTYLSKAPRQFWYCVPESLAEKVLPEVPAWAGLLTSKDCRNSLEVIKKSPTNNDSEKLSLADCARLLRNVGNQLYSLLSSNQSMRNAGYSLDPHANDSFYSKKLEWDGEHHVWVPNYDYLNFQI